MIDIKQLQQAFILFTQREFDKAEKIYIELLNQEPDNVFVLQSYGLFEFQKQNYLKSALLLQKAVDLGKNDENTYLSLVKSLRQIGRFLEAEKYCIDYLKSNPKVPSLWLQLGFLKEFIYSDDKLALECFEEALNLGVKEAYYNIAANLQKQREFAKAEEYFLKMLEYSPNDNETLTSLGMCKLTQKKFKEGYELFVKRKTSKNFPNLWRGGDLEKNLNVYCDQGFGDHIQFIRYIPLLKEKVETLNVGVHPYLKSLFQKNYPDINFVFYNELDNNTQTLRITDSAYALNLDFENIPYKEGYLDSEKTDIISDKIKVGLCWEAGSIGSRTMIQRTINIEFLAPIFELDNIQTYSFQVGDSFKGCEQYPQMINLASDFKTFEDTAKAMKSMDLMLTVDTSVAHLAGAMGIKTYLLLPYASDWRWFSDTKTTPWYDSIEIFKQIDAKSWEKPIGDILCRLKEYSL